MQVSLLQLKYCCAPIRRVGDLYLHKKDGCLLLRVVLAGHLFQCVQQVAASEPLHENDHLLLILNNLIALHNVWMVQQLQEVRLPAPSAQGMSARLTASPLVEQQELEEVRHALLLQHTCGQSGLQHCTGSVGPVILGVQHTPGVQEQGSTPSST